MKLRQKLLTGTLVFVSILMCGCSKDVQKQQKTAETETAGSETAGTASPRSRDGRNVPDEEVPCPAPPDGL